MATQRQCSSAATCLHFTFTIGGQRPHHDMFVASVVDVLLLESLNPPPSYASCTTFLHLLHLLHLPVCAFQSAHCTHLHLPVCTSAPQSAPSNPPGHLQSFTLGSACHCLPLPATACQKLFQCHSWSWRRLGWDKK